MSQPNFGYAVPGGPAPRPTAVVIAAFIQFGLLALALLTTLLALLYFSDMNEATQAEMERQGVSMGDGELDLVYNVSLVAGTVVGLALSAAYGLLGIFNLRGANGARITTWILSGFQLLCVLCAFGSNALNSALPDADEAGFDSDAVQEAAYAETPFWYPAFESANLIIVFVGVIAVIVLLALPKSNEFFRKPPPAPVLPPEAG